MKMEKYFRYIFSVFCLIGCFYQVYCICEIYLSYETSTDVRYEKEISVSLPGITTCSSKSYFINDKFYLKLFSNDTERLISFNESFIINDYLNKLSIKDQFEALYPSSEIFNLINCTVKGNSTGKYLENCSSISPIRISIDWISHCLSIFSAIEE